MLRYILITISCILAGRVSAQDTILLQNVNTIVCMSIDSKGNIFAADNNFTLCKYDTKGKLITNVNIKSYGEITSIDCTNPFEIYVFHKDQNIMVFYDNMLNVRGELRLNDYFLSNVACVARSYDNNIWVVDLSQYKLLKINKIGEVIAESAYLNSTLSNELNIYTIWEFNNEVYLGDSLVGVYVFDMYATYSTTHYTPNNKAVVGKNGRMHLSIAGKLHLYNTLARDLIKTEVSLPKSTSFSLYNKALYYYSKNNVILKSLEN